MPTQPTYGLLEGTVLEMLKWAAGLLNAAPNMPVDGLQEVAAAVNWMLNLVSAAGLLIPVNTIFIIMGFTYAIKNWKFVIWSLNWIIRRVADFIP